MDLLLDHIFIDTSIFKSSSYFKKGEHVHRLFDLAEKGYVTIIMPAVTEKEWQGHFEEATKLNFDQIQRKLNLCGIEHELFMSKYPTIGLDYDTHLKKAFKSHMDRANVVRLSLDYPSDRITNIFEKYFSKKKPFGPDKKKSEFPDAFVLASLEKYAEENNLERIVVISDDNDMIGYESTLLIPMKVTDFLNEMTVDRIPQFTEKQKAKATRDTSYLSLYFQTQPTCLLTQISTKIKDFLQDETVYADRLNYADVQGIEIPRLIISFNPNEMEILSIDEESIDASVPVHIDAMVKVYHFDQENSIWDSEDKDYIIKLNTSTDIPIACDCMVTIKYLRPEKTDKETNVLDADIELEGIDLSNLQDTINESSHLNRIWDYKNNPEWELLFQHLPNEYTAELSKYGLIEDNKWKEFNIRYDQLVNEYLPKVPDIYERIRSSQDKLSPKQLPLPDFVKQAIKLRNLSDRHPGGSKDNK